MRKIVIQLSTKFYYSEKINDFPLQHSTKLTTDSAHPMMKSATITVAKFSKDSSQINKIVSLHGSLYDGYRRF